jgi:hypothetical protein
VAIYAAFGVPEIWQWHDDELTVSILEKNGRYAPCEFSLNLPMLRVKDLEPFLEWELAADESTWIRSFREWVHVRFSDPSREGAQ